MAVMVDLELRSARALRLLVATAVALQKVVAVGVGILVQVHRLPDKQAQQIRAAAAAVQVSIPLMAPLAAVQELLLSTTTPVVSQVAKPIQSVQRAPLVLPERVAQLVVPAVRA